MSDASDAFSRRFEIFANEQAAETEATRAILQGLIVHILGSHPRRDELFETLRSSVLARLDRETTLELPNPEAMRKAALVHERASRIFEEIAPSFLTPSNNSTKAN